MNVKQNGKWRMPGLTYSGDWSELSYAEISRQMLNHYGLTVTVLRRLQRGSNFMVCELEVHYSSPGFHGVLFLKDRDQRPLASSLIESVPHQFS